MHRDGLDAVRAEPLDELVGSVLGADEHEREVTVWTELLHERLDAMLVRDLHELVLDLRACAPSGGPLLVDCGSRA